MRARLTYCPSRTARKLKSITIKPVNNLGVFTKADKQWLKANIFNIAGIKYSFSIFRTKCFITFPDELSLYSFMKTFKNTFL